MLKIYTDEEKMLFLKHQKESGLRMSEFALQAGVSERSLYKWKKDLCGIVHSANQEELKKNEALNTPSDSELLEELVKLKKEKQELERELKRSNLRALAFETLVDMAESKYNIPIRKDSDAK